MKTPHRLAGLPDRPKAPPMPQITVAIGKPLTMPVETPTEHNYRVSQRSNRARRQGHRAIGT